ncbi:PEP-CTERM sorting domain-containing protein [Verrucomicrobiaceae bacterium R5-34]|uniref:PEP-CTERM sorting domain-containing protein n=1 Tax=Oceaniferula flava TaxID=2800421 RepID=A0AAE2SFI2_9BACT|nr:PEP-CTERM sorting domain-containing protein [Oceaniferula flavus]MBK1831227.1 PEP-CTERM sorting domain-containing protein [Verrucomicrobiaceae bacterium R5-34]MBK1855396.1 PEP-CTERM sorting domain-containing protein [Oceaniferula flavus]MBM1136702.1 PEP-CTERM sorting domain-containing protein [Oceaniferula flavus]
MMATLALSGAQVSAAISLSTTEPTDDVLLDYMVGSKVSTKINSTAAQGSRGSGFSLESSLGGSQFDISSITLDTNANTLAEGFEFTVSIIQAGDAPPYYQGVYSVDYTAVGSGNVTAANFASAVGGSILGEETFTIGTGGLTTLASEYITFEFSSAIRVDADTQLAVLVSTNGEFNQYEGTNNANLATPTALNRILFSDTSTSTPDMTGSSRDFRFLVSGTVVPEPSSAALLGLGGLALMLRRRK